MSTIVEWAAALGTISAACTIIVKAITRDVARDCADLKHSVKNQTMRIDGLEHQRVSDVERIVKLESALQSVDRSIERVERGQDKLDKTINDRFDVLSESIREIRTVAPR